MADRRDSDTSPSPEWMSQQWDTLCDILGTDDPEDVVPRVRTLKENMARIDEESNRPQESFVTISEVEEVFREMHDRLQKLRERNAKLVEQLEGQDDEGVETAFKELHHQTESILEELDVSSVEDGLSRVQSMNRQLENLYHEKEVLVEAGFTDAQSALDEIQALEQQLEEASSGPDTSVFHAATAIRDVIGVSTIGEAEALVRTARSMTRQLQERAEQMETRSPMSGVDDQADLADLIASIEKHLTVLHAEWAARETEARDAIPEEVGTLLGVSSVEDAERLVEMARSLQEITQSATSVAGVASQTPSVTPSKIASRSAGDGASVQDAETAMEILAGLRSPLVDVSRYVQDALPAEIGDILGVENANEARQLERLVRSMSNRLGEYKEEWQWLTQQAGVNNPDGVLEMIASMESQLVDVYERLDQQTQVDASAAEEKSTAPSETEREVLDILGVDTPEGARELAELVRSMSDQLERLTKEKEKLVNQGLTVESALGMIDSMEEQLVDLYEDRESNRQVISEYETTRSVLGVETPEEARELADLVKSLHDRMAQLRSERSEMLEATGVASSEDVTEMIRSMEDQLIDLYEEREDGESARATLDEIEQHLGIRSAEGAREIADLARSMKEEISDYEAEQRRLEQLGLSNTRDAVVMVESMQEQLDELYQERESMNERAAAFDEGQDTFQQLEALYAERERLERELGLAEADDIIEMVEGLATQLDDLYQDREASSGVDAGGADSEIQTLLDEHAEEDDGALMLSSMEQQLQDLYGEKKQLLDLGFGSTQEAADRIRSLEEERSRLSQASTECRQRFERLERELGVSGVSGILDLVSDLKNGSASVGVATSGNAPSSRSAASSGGTRPSSKPQDAPSGLKIHAAPAFVSKDTLQNLEQLDSQALDALEFGVVRLSERGDVQFVNEVGLTLPGLKEHDNKTTILGKNFFYDLAPSTNNNLFFGRFKQGLEEGAMDARFPYTFISPGQGPTVLVVHLHSKPNTNAHWLLFRKM